MGGQLNASVKRLTAVAKGLNYSYGIETKIKILKNHLNAPHNVCYEGSMVAVDNGFISIDELDNYKKNRISFILKELQKLADNQTEVTENDISFHEIEEEN